MNGHAHNQRSTLGLSAQRCGWWVTPVSLCLTLLMGCSVPKHPVKGHIGPFPIQTTVDAPVARRYLESSLRAEERAQLEELEGRFKEQLPGTRELRELAEERSVDFAALFFAQQLLRVPKVSAVHRVYFHYLGLGEEAITPKIRDEYVVVLVPGYDHLVTGPETGADLKQAREILAQVKVKSFFVELNPVGEVVENAAKIAKLIREKTSPEQKVVISGASSGGASIHYALGALLSEREAERVVGWINLGGLMRGSRVADWMNSGWRYPFFRAGLWFTRWNAESVVSLSTTPSRERLRRSKLSPQLTVINFLGLSLSGSITDSEFSQYNFMRDWGPNDGFSLLPEMILPETLTVIAPECDHFFGEDPLIHLKALALLATVIDITESRLLCGACWGDEGPFPSQAFKGREPKAAAGGWSEELELYRQLPHLSQPPPSED